MKLQEKTAPVDDFNSSGLVSEDSEMHITGSKNLR